MSETVYVLGAGINRTIRDYQNLKPPLATDLFKQALRHEMLEAKGREEIEELFAYIWKYWKLSIEDLKEEPFDLEACFTLLQQQRVEAASDADTSRDLYLAKVEDQLSSLLTRFLGHMESHSVGQLSPLAEQILAEGATVLTFNYDTIIEDAIESVAGDKEEPSTEEGSVPDGRLSYSQSNWNRTLAYGVRFDEVHLQQTGTVLEPVESSRFYAHPGNELYSAPILKLHGSLNWFVHTSRRNWDNSYGGPDQNPKEGQVVLSSGYPHIKSGFGPTSDSRGWILQPLIVTPVLYKELGDDGPVGKSWRRARKELSDCRRLVVAGYSFPPTDFAVRRLFLEAFVEGPPKELMSVNPDRSVAGTVASLCHFRKKPLVRESIEEFLEPIWTKH